MALPCGEVNRQLLPVKLMYFFFMAGTLLPFIPVYMRQLGLSAEETGIIYGVMPFVAFFVRPLIGVLADKIQRHKAVLIVCVLLTGVMYDLLLLTPAKQTHDNSALAITVHMQCSQADSFIRDCNFADDGCEMGLKQALVANNLTGISRKCEFQCSVSRMSIKAGNTCFTADVGTLSEVTCDSVVNTGHDVMFQSDVKGILENEIQMGNSSYSGHTCTDYDLKNLTFNGTNYWQLLCESETVFNCNLHCTPEISQKCMGTISSDDKLSETFWIFFVIFLFCNIVFAPVISLIDAIAYDILGEKRGLWGRQRLWGTLGFIFFAVASTFIMDAISQKSNNVDYSVSFYIFMALTICTCVVGYFLKLSENIHCGQFLKNILGLLKYPKVVVFLIAMACYGIMNGVIEAFLFWYLMMLGASQKILGLCIVFQCGPEIIMLQFAGKIIKRIGHISCLHIACLGYAIRFFCYSIIPGPWYVLPVELLHCLTFALMYAAASSYASVITPEGMSATVQGLLFDARTGLGPVWTFRVYGFFAIAVLLVYGAVHFAFFRDASSDKDIVSDEQAGKAISEESAKGVAEKLLGAEEGVGALLPFITVYMRQLGLSAKETGIIYGVMPFVAFFVRPLIGVLADKIQRHKAVLIVCVLLTGVLYDLLLLTPAKQTHDNSALAITVHIQCSQADSFIRDCNVANGGCEMGLKQALVANNLTGISRKCEFQCSVSRNSIKAGNTCFTDDVGTLSEVKCGSVVNTGDDVMFQSDVKTLLANEIQVRNSSYSGNTCTEYDLKNVTFNGTNYWQLLCASETVFNCKLHCTPEISQKCMSTISSDDELSETFWIFFVIFLSCNIVFSPVFSLIDAIAYDILGEKRGSWGRQRLWGTVGYITFAVASTFIMDAISKKSNVDYSVSFYIFLALNICTCVVGYFLKLSENIHCGQLFKNILGLLKYPKVVVFLIAMACYGIMNGVIEAFLFWYLIMLGASQKILGLCVVFQCVPEIIMLLFAGKIIKRIGHMSCLHIACLGYAIRFFCYSIIPGPWYVLPVELLHCLTFSLMYAAASSYASVITPEGMSATVQGLVGGLHFGFGKGIGSLVTGQLFDARTGLGPVWTFRVYGFFAIAVLLVYGAVHFAFFRDATSDKDIASDRQAGEEESSKDAAEKLLGAGDGAAVELQDRTEPC
ncbi:MFSD6-like protein [Mya arenaria]|uniref:MFSD6-like protein n=1 Tax=Mya arenaria TaxID=6604 RepID=A0ABY7DT87_MYAAR|nr:MFSD6-like protein [Mya arenaria]